MSGASLMLDLSYMRSEDQPGCGCQTRCVDQDLASHTSSLGNNLYSRERQPVRCEDATSTMLSGSEQDKITADMMDLSFITTLVVDDGDNVASDITDTDEELLPSISSRAGISEETLRSMFSTYNLPYQPLRRWPADGRQKSIRVEKPIRVKMYWTCHECRSVFGRGKTCEQCRHVRCEDCPNVPAARVTQLLAAAQELQGNKQIEKTEEAADSVGETRQGLDAGYFAGTVPTHPEVVEAAIVDTYSSKTVSIPASLATLNVLEQDDEAEDDGGGEDWWGQHRQRMALHVRPRTTEELMLRPAVQIIRRSCHHCNTPFIPANRTDCANCDHERCAECPRWPPKSNKWPDGSPGDKKPTPIQPSVVQRVYKKPRIRVRYTCEQCDTVFTERNVCTNCGHARCRSCHRTPSPKSSTPDPAAVISVAHRLEAHDHAYHPAADIG